MDLASIAGFIFIALIKHPETFNTAATKSRVAAHTGLIRDVFYIHIY